MLIMPVSTETTRWFIMRLTLFFDNNTTEEALKGEVILVHIDNSNLLIPN
jgi:hypothetical protein